MALAQKDMVTSPDAVVVSTFLMGMVVAVIMTMVMAVIMVMPMIVIMAMRVPVRTQCVVVRHEAQLSVFSL